MIGPNGRENADDATDQGNLNGSGGVAEATYTQHPNASQLSKQPLRVAATQLGSERI